MIRAFLYSWNMLAVWMALAFCTMAHGQDKLTDSRQADATPTKPVGQILPLGDYGADEVAYLAIPTTPPTLGIVLVPDSFGLDDFTKAEAMRLAGQGYLVMALDIYNGRLTTDVGERANLTANLNAASVMKAVNASIRFFHESSAFHVDHIVTMGWGVGASYVFQAARENKTLDGAIMFYGPVLPAGSPVSRFAAPICAVYPANDPTTTHEAVVSFQHAMKDANNDFEAWFIAADHGWSNPQSKTHNAVEDREAWKVAMPFLVRIGAEPVKPKNDSIIDKAKDKIESLFK